MLTVFEIWTIKLPPLCKNGRRQKMSSPSFPGSCPLFSQAFHPDFPQRRFVGCFSIDQRSTALIFRPSAAKRSLRSLWRANWQDSRPTMIITGSSLCFFLCLSSKKNGINRHSALQPEFLACRAEREKRWKLKCFLNNEEYIESNKENNEEIL